jgi:hypothetical protein
MCIVIICNYYIKEICNRSLQMGASSSNLWHTVTVHATADGVSPPPACPVHKKNTADVSPPSECPMHKPKAAPSECPVNYGTSMSECPASVELKQSLVPDADIDPANMVRLRTES